MFLSSPHPQASIEQWRDHIKGLQKDDIRKPFVAMALRRAKQHLSKLEKEKGITNECKESESTPQSTEESSSQRKPDARDFLLGE